MMAASLSSSFVFYQSFYDMIAWIPELETQLAAYGMICAYALNGVEPQTDNWVLNLVFCAVKPLIDNNRKRRENGKKGGRKPAVADMEMTAAMVTEAPLQQPGERETVEAQAELQTAQVQAAPAVVVSQTTEPETAPQGALQTMVQQTEAQSTQWTAQPEGQAMVSSTDQQAVVQQRADEQAGVWEGEPILRYGENKYPITQRELNKVQRFAQELFQTYGGGRRPNEADMERVMEYTVARREIDGDRAVAVLDEGRADLLWYAFEKASAAQKLNWRYIDGMYRRFEQRDITTGAEAYQYDLLRGMTVS